MIAIKSNRILKFPPSPTNEGFVQVKMDMITNYPDEELYRLRIRETSYIMNEGKKKIVGTQYPRIKPMTYSELDELAVKLDVDMTDKTKQTENLNELFRQGLLLITQAECLAGDGRYGSQAEDWEIER